MADGAAATKRIKTILNEDRVFQQVLGINAPLMLKRALTVVAMKPGVSVSDVAEALGTNMSSASRYLSTLSNNPSLKGDNLGLIALETTIESGRTKRCILTPKGKLLWDSIAALSEEN